MNIELKFSGKEHPSIQLQGETDAERAILGFLAEGRGRRWKVHPVFDYRPGGVEALTLYVDVEPGGGRSASSGG